MSTFLFWQRWLVAVGMLISLFGMAMALLSATPLFDVFNRQIDPAFWGTGAAGEPAARFQQWVYGVWGATIAGWGIFVTCIARHPFRKRERWAWNCVVSGLVLWFVLDTSLSCLYKVYFNAAFNTALFVLAMLPVMFTRREFIAAGKG
jgi:hypothetical protein